MSVVIEYLAPMYQVLCVFLPRRYYLQSLGFHQMALPPSAGVYYVCLQCDEMQYYLTFDQNSLPTVDLLSPGSQSQRRQVSAGSDANARTLRNAQVETYIGRSAAADQNGILAVPSVYPGDQCHGMAKMVMSYPKSEEIGYENEYIGSGPQMAMSPRHTGYGFVLVRKTWNSTIYNLFAIEGICRSTVHFI